MKYINGAAAMINFTAAGVCAMSGEYFWVGLNMLFGAINFALTVEK